MAVIPFYGADDPDLFAIERSAMDRRGRVVACLDSVLPSGVVLDIGAGDGFTACRLAGPRRTVVALEPAAGMVRADRPLPWVRGDAESLPFDDDSFDGAYATWAYFFPGFVDVGPGLAEVRRVVRPGCPIVVVDNLGDDQFTALAERPISADVDFWAGEGFDVVRIDTAFEFESLADAQRLLGHFFGTRGVSGAERVVGYRVGAFIGRA
jgi:SAM-dependent methyltransferase